MQEIITVSGLPFAGVNLVARIISRNYGFVHRSANALTDGIYNDLCSILHFTYPQRSIAKTDVIVKNSGIIEKSIGIPMEVNFRYLYEWVSLVEQREVPLRVKVKIYNDLCMLSKTWRKLFLREDTVSMPTKNFVISHAYSLPEFNITRNNLRIWVEADHTKRYQNCFSKGMIYDTEIYGNKWITDLTPLKNQADFILYNDGSKHQLGMQITKLMKEVLGFEETSQTI